MEEIPSSPEPLPSEHEEAQCSQGLLQHQVLDYLKNYGRKYCHVPYTRFSLDFDVPIGPAI